MFLGRGVVGCIGFDLMCVLSMGGHFLIDGIFKNCKVPHFGILLIGLY